MENNSITTDSPDNVLVALDLGSNSFHMVIARIVEGNLQILSRHKEKVRLAAGLDEHNHLDDAAMQRGLQSLSRFNERLQPFDTTKVRIVATHTLRKASNARDFLRQAETVLSHPVEVISGHEEARLILKAVAHAEVTEDKTLIIDIGGGSTELALGLQQDVLQLASRTMGCVSYTQQFFADGISKSAFKKAILAAQQQLEPVIDHYRRTGWSQVLATSGTASALAACAQEMGFGDISSDSLKELQKVLIDQQTDVTIKGVSADRMQVLAGGLAIMSAIVAALGIESVRYSPAALREGVLYEMHGGMEHSDVRRRTRESLMARYTVDQQQAERVTEVAIWLWQQVKQDWSLPDSSLSLIRHAAYLHEIGLNINSSAIQRHSAYIIENTNLPGFNRDEQLVLANLVRFHRKRLQLNQLLPIEQLMKDKTLVRLIRLLRIAVLLNLGRQGYAQPSNVAVDGKSMTLTFAQETLESQQLLCMDLDREVMQLSAAGFSLNYLAG
ncbi:exopolyphosphatase [Neiella marina]|uniref:Exopolyphosphatase n=1 Tax=Neiella holothuriorum TaxID=2870530 RepID=A0ABS7EM06_9GAMM|nr:exopolyphosphatase [Neiella holothuriorum]MBW8192712.1 exopolyphosphatase [Neiella holothuriorum]